MFLCGLSLVAVSGGYSHAVMHEFLTAVASPVVENRLEGPWTSGVAAHELSSVAHRL